VEPVRSIEELTRRNVAIIAQMEKASANHRTRGERVTDRIASWVGSWTFIIAQTAILESLRRADDARISRGLARPGPPGRADDRGALYLAVLATGDVEAGRALGPDYEVIAACIRNDLDWLRGLPEPGPGTPPEPDRDYEWSPLHHAANRGHLEVVRWLVERGAAVNRREANGFTPILLAAAAGHREVVRFLAAHGGEVEPAVDRRPGRGPGAEPPQCLRLKRS
jgi:hypothetical protein